MGDGCGGGGGGGEVGEFDGERLKGEPRTLSFVLYLSLVSRSFIYFLSYQL